MSMLSGRYASISRLSRILVVMPVCAGLLTACDYETTESIQTWLQTTRQQARAQALPLHAPKQFIPYRYTAHTLVEPFNNMKFDLAYLQQRATDGVNPDLNRRLEPLETYPIEMIRVVGTLLNKGKKTALLQVDNMVYPVTVGHYAGQNFGKIEQITDNAVEITELIPDIAHTWRKRTVRLVLQETDND